MKNYRLYVYLAFLSLFFMLIVTTTSPLYYVNNADDGNIMFTVGKAVLHGLMPYKDLFDQRGPLMYFMNTIASLISYKSFLGVFIFEVVATFLDFAFLYKTFKLRYSNKFSALSVIFLVPFLFNSKLFIYGNTPEEYVLPLIIITIYLITKESLEKWNVSKYILMGLFLGISFWTKFTLSTTWIILFIVTIFYFVYMRNYKMSIRVAFYGLFGFLIVTVPIIIIFTLKQSLYSLFYVYFYLNITKYYGDRPSLIFQTILMLVIIFCCVIYIKIYKDTFKTNKIQTHLLSLILISNVIILFYSMKQYLFYYFYILEFTFIVIPIIFYNILIKFKFIKKLYILVPLLSISLIFVTNKNYLNSSFLKNENQSVDFYKKNRTPYQIEFSEIIKKSKNQTFLNYNSMDVGIYTYSGLVPNVKYFMINNMPYSVMYKKQDDYLKSLKFKYIVIRHDFLKKTSNSYYVKSSIYNVLKRHYKLIAKRDVLFQKNKTGYLLFEKK